MKSQKSQWIVVGLCAVFGTSIALGQTHVSPSPSKTINVMYPGGGYNSSDYYDYPDRATNAYQGIDYGLARIIRAESEYMLLGSQAAINRSEARSREMDNWKKWVETYFEVKRINREARAAERGRPLTEADFVRMAQMGKPRRLTPSELENVTGQLNWPLLLQAKAFTPYRELLDQCFAYRASRGAMELDEYLKAEQTAQLMLGMLRDQIQDFAGVDYMNARRFLESIAYEARFPVTDGAASTVGQRDTGATLRRY
jgi:hypothetical protein